MIKEGKNRISKLVDYYWVVRVVFVRQELFQNNKKNSDILVWSPAAFVPWRCLKRVNYRLSGDLHFKCDFQNRNELRPTCYNDSSFHDVIAIMCHYWQSTCLHSGGWKSSVTEKFPLKCKRKMTRLGVFLTFVPLQKGQRKHCMLASGWLHW